MKRRGGFVWLVGSFVRSFVWFVFVLFLSFLLVLVLCVCVCVCVFLLFGFVSLFRIL